MSNRYVGGVITEKVNVAQAPWSGEWTEQTQLQAKAQGTWAPYSAQVTNSLRFRSSASAYLSRTPSVNGNRLTWTLSVWFKLGAAVAAGGVIAEAGSTDGSYYTGIRINSSNQFYFLDSPGGGNPCLATSAMVLRDPSAWYHLVVSVDTTQANGANRVRFFINGSQITMNFTATYPQNSITSWNSTSLLNALAKSARNDAYQVFTDIYLAEVNFIDGQALTPSYFGQFSPTTGVWGPTVYGGTYGTNGFYLKFNNGTSTTTLGNDSSGNGNNWTTNNISLTAGSTYDWMLDSPTPLVGTSYGVGNYAVLNPLDPNVSGLSVTISNGNLTASGSAYGATVYNASMQIPQSGKWYYETSYSTIATAVFVGIRSYSTGSTDVRYKSDGQKEVGGTTSSYGASWTTGDAIGVAVDRDAGTVTFYKNGASQGAINIPTNSAVFDTAWNQTAPYGSTAFSVTFGQRPFSYTPPSGFKSLCTYNLPTATINNGAQYMAATTYTGNGSTQSIANTVNGVYFKPDFVWTKSRSAVAWHSLVDAVRGISKNLFSNATNAETTYTGYTVTSFNNNGATVVDDATGSYGVNGAGITYVSWQWKASNATAVSNTSGTITSQVSASALSGFSVVTYTGTGVAGTIGHGLGVTPAFIITKSRSDATTQWVTWHKDLSGAFSATCGYIYLNATNAASTTTIFYNGTQINSTTIGLQGTGTNINNTGSTYVAYCFAAIAGYSAFGSYTGNGSTDGPFVYCGFRPRFILVKRTDSTGNWCLFDSSRLGYNGASASKELYPNLSLAEGTANGPDQLSNGFKFRDTYSDVNASGGTYIYAAFAENPFTVALAR